MEGSVVKNLPANRESRRPWFSPWVRKIPWRWKHNSFQYSCLGNLVDRGARQATVYGVAKESDTI